MSTKIDERVVEMRFDNAQFEKNVSTTMSTLDKLKQRLNLTGASKGLENVSSAAKKVDLSGIGTAVDSVRVKFSALEVMGVTALANITNSAVNAGKRMVSALTIDPIKTGFQEYETQINAIQTILANTQSKGSTLEDVNAALDELNKYADMTIYNFTEMTRNIGTFTAAGVDLEKSVTSIKGIANLAAVSGSNATQASTAMYQLSQALAAGRVSLMDWNSVVNAGMGGEVFQTALKRTAEHFGYNVDGMIKKYGSFRESLTEGGWLTAEVLTETLTQLSGAYSEADLIAQGYSKDQAKAITELAATAVSAATDVKTFTQLWDTLKEAAQSGWTQTWEILIGDFGEAKELFSEAYDLFGGMIEQMSTSRNTLLEGAFSSSWDQLSKKINEAGVATEDFNSELEKTVKAHGSDVDKLVKDYGSLEEAFRKGAISSDLITETLKRIAGSTGSAATATEDMTGKLEYFQKVVDEVWMGDYKNGRERIDALTAAGYDYAKVQDLVNKTVDGHRLTLEDLTDTQLKSVGYTDEQVKAIRELADQAELSGTSIHKLIEDMSRPSGRELLIDSFRNAIYGLVDVCKAVGAAWRNAFPPMTSDQLYNAIKAVNDFSKTLIPTPDTIDKLTRTFKGLFAILDIVTTLFGGGLKLGLKVLGKLLGAVDLDILSVTAHIGDTIVGFRDFLFNNKLINEALDTMVDGIEAGIKAFKKLVDAFLKLPIVRKAIDNLKDGFSNFKDIGKWAIEGLKNGLNDGIRSIPGLILNLGKMILETIKGVLGINSPSTEMYDVGKFSIQGLVDGFMDGVETVIDTLKLIAEKCIDIIGGIDWGSIAATGISIGILYIAKQLVGIIGAFSAPLEGVGAVLSSVANVIDEAAKPIAKTIKSFSKVMSSFAFKMKADALKSIAIALAILAGSIFLLAQLDTAKLWSAIGAMAALAGIIGVLSFAVKSFGADGAVNFAGFAVSVVGIAAALLIMSIALKKIDGLDPEKLNNTVSMFVLLLSSLFAVIYAYGTFVSDKASANISKLGTMMLKLSVSLLLLVAVIKLISGLSAADLAKGGAAILAFSGIIALLSYVSKAGKNVDQLGNTMIKLAAAMTLMVVVMKLVGGMSVRELIKGAAAISFFTGIISTLMIIMKFGGKNATKLGGTLVGIAASMAIMVGVIKLVSGLEVGEIAKGVAAISVFSGIIAGLIYVLKLAGDDAPKIAATLLAMSISIGILAAVSVLLSLVDLAGLAKGIVAVGLLSSFMALMIAATKNAQDIKGNLIVMSVAIGIMAVSVAALSFIDPSRLAGATASISILMGMFALIVKMGSNVTSSMGPLIVMTVAIGVLGGIIYLLSGLPIESVLGVSAAISVLLLSLSAALFIASTVSSVSPMAIVALGAMVVVAGILGGLLYLLSGLPVESTLGIVVSLSALLLSLSAACLIMAALSLVTPAAIAGVAGFAIFVAELTLLLAALGGLAQIPGLKWLIDEGGQFLSSIGEALGGFVGGFIGGVMGGITSQLPQMGTDLSTFMTNLQPFISGAKAIDQAMLDGVETLAKTILILTGVDLLDSLTSWLTGGSSLADFGAELVPFGEAMAAFSSSMAGKVDPDLVVAAATAGKALAEMAATLPNSGGIAGFFAGENDVGEFADQLVPFGEAMTGFSKSVKDIDPEAVEKAAIAGKSIAELAATLPNSGGVAGFFAGENDMETFGKQLIPFGEAMTGFSNAVVDLKADAVEKAAIAGKSISELAATLPNSGGVAGFFSGENDMQSFGEQLIPFGEAMTGFSNAVADLKADAVEKAAIAGKSLAELATSIPSIGGLKAIFTGDDSMAMFGLQLVSFGESFSKYSKSMESVNPDIVSATTNAAKSVVALQKSLPEKGGWLSDDQTLADFGKDIASFGEKFAAYYSKVSGINAVQLSGATIQLSKLIEVAKGISGVDAGKVSSFGSALSSLGNAGVKGFIKAFTESTGKVKQAATGMITAFVNAVESNQYLIKQSAVSIVNAVITTFNSKRALFTTAGQSSVTAVTSGALSRIPTVVSAFTSISNRAASSVRGTHSLFYNAGAYLVEGFANGISANTFKAEAQARAMAAAAAEAARRELDEHSPSRVGYQIGDFFGLGFVNAIRDSRSSSYKAASEMANSAKSGLTEAVSKIKDFVNGDMDVQPTIRPVLDLSDVQSGASKLNTMFSRNRALSVAGSMPNSSFDSANQNGADESASGATFNFTQNNYSPKALSRIDIYRQTKNQFSAMKGLVKNK